VEKLKAVKSQLSTLPGDIQKLREQAKLIQAELVLDGPRQSRSAELAKIQAQIVEKEELQGALESALVVVYERLALAVEAESNAARESVMSEVPKLQAQLDQAQARFQEAIDQAVESGAAIWGTGARLKNRIDKSVRECLADRVQVYQNDALERMIWSADDRAESASMFNYIMAQHSMDPGDVEKVIEAYQDIRARDTTEAEYELSPVGEN